MIDTLSMAENLTAAGIEQKQAKAIAQTIGQQHSETASKQDIDALKESMNAQFAAIKWIVGAHAGLTLVLLAAFLAG